jgi:PLD-like domain
MQFNELIDGPGEHELQSVLNGKRLDLIAPYARRGPLRKILPANHDRVRIIVRLPLPGLPFPRRLENDPRDLLELSETMGAKAQIYALPGVHTKLYLNGATAFYGSANFTTTGFGWGYESLLSTTDPASYGEFTAMFEKYRQDATRLHRPFLRLLAKKFGKGDFDYTALPERPVTLFPNPNGDDEGDFRSWLVATGEQDGQYIEDRFDRAAGYQMTGHTQSAFPGLRAFLRSNLDLIPLLADQTYQKRAFWTANIEETERLKQFVLTYGHLYPANGGGAWHNKLPPFLGGPGQPGGGKSSGLIARMLIYLSRYAIDKGF